MGTLAAALLVSGITGSVFGLAIRVSVYCDWVDRKFDWQLPSQYGSIYNWAELYLRCTMTGWIGSLTGNLSQCGNIYNRAELWLRCTSMLLGHQASKKQQPCGVIRGIASAKGLKGNFDRLAPELVLGFFRYYVHRCFRFYSPSPLLPSSPSFLLLPSPSSPAPALCAVTPYLSPT